MSVEPGDPASAAPGPSVSMKFSYTRDDLAHAFHSTFTAQRGVRFNVFMAICLVALGLWLVGDPKHGLLALACLVVSGVFVALVAFAWFFEAGIAIRREPRYRDTYDLTFDDAGVSFRKKGKESQLPWTIYTHAVAHAHGWQLHFGRDDFSIIPARVLASDEDRATFAALVEAHIPRLERR